MKAVYPFILLLALLVIVGLSFSINLVFVPPTPVNNSIVNYSDVVFNATVSGNPIQCRLSIQHSPNTDQLWSNVKYLRIYGGRLDYGSSQGVGNYSSPQMTNWLPIGVGELQTCYVLNTGNSACYGLNAGTQKTNYSGGDAVAVSAGQQYTCYLLSNGNSACYGTNGWGQSTNYTGTNAIALSANYDHTCYLLSNGSSLCYGKATGEFNCGPGQTTAYPGSDAIGVAAGHCHTCYLLSNGSSACYGGNAYGQAANHTGGNAIAVSAGRYYTCYLLSNGNSTCYGRNDYGQSTNYTGGDAISVSAGEYQACYLLSNGNSVCYGDNSHGEAANYTGGDALAVVAGWYHTCYLLRNGSSTCYGYNPDMRSDPYTGGNLMIPFANASYSYYNDSMTFVALSVATYPAHLADANYTIRVNCTDSAGKYVSGSRIFAVETHVIISGVVNEILPGETSAMVNWSTDKNTNSTLNYGTTPGLGTYATDSPYSTFHSMTLTGLGPSTTYYYNITSCTALGLCNTSGTFNFTTDITPPLVLFVPPTPDNVSVVSYTDAINLSVNENATQCLLYLQDVLNPAKLWGNVKHLGIYGGTLDYNASLGVNNYSSFTMQHRLPMAAGNYQTCYLLSNGNSFCYGGGNNYTGRNAIEISVGDSHTCYLLSNGNSACYGSNSSGQATNYTGGDAIALSAGGYQTCYLLPSGNSACYGDNTYGQSANYTGGDAIALSAGTYHTCYLLSSGNSACYGRNDYSQSINYTGGNAIALATGRAHTCYLITNGNSVCYGSGDGAAPAINYTGGNAIALAAGTYHTCYLLSNGNSFCAGYNTYGRTTPYTGGDAIGVSATPYSTCYLLSNGNSGCYNANNYTGGNLKMPFATGYYPMQLNNAGAATTASYGVDLSHGNYSIYANCTDLSGNSNISETRVFSLQPSITISGVSAKALGDEISAMVNWTTDGAANSTVNYGTTTSLGTFADEFFYFTFHTMTLTGLTANITYYYNVTSCNPLGICNTSGTFSFTTDATPPSISFTGSTPPDGSIIGYSTVVINATVSENVTQCLLSAQDLLNPGKLWSNVKHLGIYGGRFDYNASIGANNYTSFTMQHRVPLSTGTYHTCYLLTNGNSVCYGDDTYGQSTAYTGGNAIAVSTGGYQSCYLLSNGNATCYGRNDYHQATSYTGGDAIALSAGGGHICYLLSNGNSVCYGDNSNGKATNYSGGNAIVVSASDSNTCYLLSNGNSTCYGSNASGMSTSYRGGDAVGVGAGNTATCYLLSNGNVTCYGDNTYSQATNYTGGDAVAVSGGNYYSCYLLSNGNSVCYGYNDASGRSTSYTGGDAIGVSAGTTATCYLRSNGNSVCYGYSWYGAVSYTGGNLKVPFATANAMQVNNADSATTADYTFPSLADSNYTISVNCTDPAGNSNISQTAFSLQTSIAISGVSAKPLGDETSAMVNWTTDKGANSTVNYGTTTALGTYATDPLYLTFHSMTLTGLTANITYYYNVTSCNSLGTCNTSGTFNFTSDANPPAINFTSPTPQNGSIIDYQNAFVNVTLSENVSQCLFFMPDPLHAIKLWSNVKHLGLYDGSFDYNASLGVNNYFSFTMQHRLSLAAGDNYTCYLLSNGNSTCYGNNTYGQSTNYSGGDAIAVSAGQYHACYLLSNGNSACYGNNANGEATNYAGGDAIAVSAGYSHTCYLLSNGNSVCYGTNGYGQATSYTGGDAIAVSAADSNTCYLLSSGNSLCYGDNNWDKSTNYTGGNAIGLATGPYLTCYLLSNGNSTCYGNNYGGMSTAYTGGNAIAVSAGYTHTCYLLSNGNSACYGGGFQFYFGQATAYTAGNAIGVAAGYLHTCYLLSNGNSFCYGTNTSGQSTGYSARDLKIPFAAAHAMQVTNASNATTANYTLPSLPDGNYTIRVNCTDPAGNSNVSETVFSLETFITISGVSASSLGDEISAMVNWTTDKGANSTVNYGTTPALGIYVTSPSNSTFHSMTLTGLTPATAYYYNITSCNAVGLCNSSGNLSFSTGITAPAINFTDPTLLNDSAINYQGAVINVTLDKNLTQCLLFVRDTRNLGKLWTNIRHLNIYGGEFDYNASIGVGNYSSFTMLSRNPISTGSDHTCYLLSTGNSLCYGKNNYGQSINYSGGDAVAVSVGSDVTCYLLSNGNSACYGSNSSGQATNYTGGNAIAIYGSCYLLSNGNSACYGGSNYTGGNAIKISGSCYLLSNGNSLCSGSYSQCYRISETKIACHADVLPVANYTGGNAIAVAGGVFHTCYLLSNGNSQCDGYNDYGESTPYTGGNAIAVSAGNHFTCYLLSNGSSACYGSYYRSGCISGGPIIHFIEGQYIQMPGYTGANAIALSSGADTACYLLSNGSSACYGDGSVCYGDNLYGQLNPYNGGILAVPFAAAHQMVVNNSDASTTATLPMPTLQDGIYNFYVEGIGVTGDTNVTETRTFTIDTTPPAVTLLSPIAGAVSIGGPMTFTFASVDSMSATTACDLFFDGVLNQTNPAVANDTPTDFAITYVGPGSHNWSVNCTDNLNNTGHSEVRHLSPPPEAAVTRTGTLGVSLTPVCGGFVVTVTADGSPVNSAVVDVEDITHGTSRYDYTNSSGRVQFDGCGMVVNVTATTGRAEGSAYQTVRCASCRCSADSDCASGEICRDHACIPSCMSDSQCTEGEHCQRSGSAAGSCQPNPPPVTPPKPPPGANASQPTPCNTTDQCGASQSCNANVCTDITGQCGHAANHAWIPYACGREEGCPFCTGGNVCIDHACVRPALITVSGKGFVGENVTLSITYPTGPCASCTLELVSPSGAKGNGTTDATGRFNLLLGEKGTYTVTLVRESRAVSVFAAPAPLPVEQPSIPTVVYNAITNPQPWLMVVLALVVALIVYLRYRGRRG